MFNTTSIFLEENSAYDGNQMMIVLGMIMTSIMTSFSGIISNLGRSLLNNLYQIFFFYFQLDESTTNAPSFIINEGVYKMVLENRSRILQGWNVRLVQNDSSENNQGKEINNHHFEITSGGIYFWIGWHLYYADYNMGGNRWWPENKMFIYGFRWSSWNLVRALNKISQKKERCVKWTWQYCRDRDGSKWTPGVGRDRYFSNPHYIETPDSKKVTEEIDRYISVLEKNNFPSFIKQSNGGKYILHGKHGTGKTTLVKKIAYEQKMDIYVVTQDVLSDKWFSRMIETLPSRSVLLFDDIDLNILNHEEEIENQKMKKNNNRENLKSVMKTVMDGTVNLPNDCLYFISSNNEELDPDITSRFTPFYMGLAGNDWRKKIFSEIFNGKNSALLEKLEGYEISQRSFSRSMARAYVHGNPYKTVNNLLKEYIPDWKEIKPCVVV